MNRIVIVGGSDAGISAAIRAREIDPELRPTVFVADRFPNFSVCGLPFFLSGEITDWKTLAHRNAADIEALGIDLRLEHRVNRIDPGKREISYSTPGGEACRMPYDNLVLGIGATSARPAFPLDSVPGVFFLRWMHDAFAVNDWLVNRQPRTAVVVGGGYVGLEMADALTVRGIDTTIIEYAPTVLQTLDPDFGQIIESELSNHGVRVATGSGVKSISRDADAITVIGSNGFKHVCDMVIVATGAVPETGLARDAGLSLGQRNAISVSRRMETSASCIFGAGDCVETWHRIMRRNTYMPLGTTAHRQGMVAGENAAGGNREFPGTLGSQVVKAFDKVAARTGLRDSEATAEGFEPFSVDGNYWDHKVYYPGATNIRIRITGDRHTGRLLGLQMVGERGAEVSKRVDVAATAIFNEMKVADLTNIDLTYTPPLSSPWDPVAQIAMVWSRKVTRTGTDGP